MSKLDVVVAYVPAIHKGYLDLFFGYRNPILLIEPYWFPELKEAKIHIDRDLRAVGSDRIKTMLKALPFRYDVDIFNPSQVAKYMDMYNKFIFPDEDISRHVAKLFPEERVIFENIFLRWTNTVAQKAFSIDAGTMEIEDAELAKLMQLAKTEAGKSSDWWRQVGSLAVTKDGQRLLAYNHHLPNAQSAYVMGDPRSSFNAGERIDLSLAIHSEASLVAQAAKKGISLEGATLFVTTFPCPICARLIAESGITTVYYEEGYSLVEAKEVLESKGVQIIRLKIKQPVTL